MMINNKPRYTNEDREEISNLYEEMYKVPEDQEVISEKNETVEEEYFTDVEDEAERIDGDLDYSEEDTKLNIIQPEDYDPKKHFIVNGAHPQYGNHHELIIADKLESTGDDENWTDRFRVVYAGRSYTREDVERVIRDTFEQYQGAGGNYSRVFVELPYFEVSGGLDI